MRIFTCPSCSDALYFDNLTCACGEAVAFDPNTDRFVSATEPCANRVLISCNWATQPGRAGRLCRACAMTETVPDTFAGTNRALWSKTEQSKRWVLASLARWGWFTRTDPGRSPIFHLLAETTRDGAVPVTMGHAGGLVTINVTEADSAESARRRGELGELFRTMTGHFRHELGHFIFERLTEQAGFVSAFRATFGDERADYGEALEAYYRDGPPDGWAEWHVTPYAASHPHEDWAESFAHFMHLTDIADSYVAAGLTSKDLSDPGYDAYLEDDPQRIITIGAHLGIALNHVNRAMGLSDLYPFVLTPAIRQKLAFVHQHVRSIG